jgi:hypothetical protein
MSEDHLPKRARTTDDPPPPAPASARVGTLFARGSPTDEISDADLAAHLQDALAKLGARRRVLLLPPDITRRMSKAGELACAAHAHYGDAIVDVMPTLGTHTPMSVAQIAQMYPTVRSGGWEERAQR